jgi:transmembrane sensor
VEAGSGALTLQAGQQCSYDPGGLRPVVAVDPREVASWQHGYVVFRAMPVALAVVEINRYRPGRVMVTSAALGRKTISGRFRIDRTDEIIGWIGQVTGATTRSLPGGIVLLS